MPQYAPKTVAFKIQSEEDAGATKALDGQSVAESKQTVSGGIKGLKWYEKLPEFDLSVHCSFIAFGS